MKDGDLMPFPIEFVSKQLENEITKDKALVCSEFSTKSGGHRVYLLDSLLAFICTVLQFFSIKIEWVLTDGDLSS